jgi:hypothetical protein
MANTVYNPGSRRISKTTRSELHQYEEQAKLGKHFDESSMIRVGLYKYPSSVFPLRNGKKALINGYPRGFPLELMVGKIAEETNRAMNPDHSFQLTGDPKLDIKLRRRIETSKTYPIIKEDLLQIAFIGFSYKWEDGEINHVDLFRDKSYSKVPTLMYEIIALDPLGEILRGRPFQGEVRRGKLPEDIGEALIQAENLGRFELPNKKIVTINEILENYEIENIYAQIQMHVKCSDKKNRIKSYQSGIKEDEVSAKEEKGKEEEFSDFLSDLKKTPSGRLAKLADTTHKGNTDMVETDYSGLSKGVDPKEETQYIPKQEPANQDDIQDMSVDAIKDPAFWNLLKESSEEIDLSQEDQELLDELKKSTAEVLGSDKGIDPHADTQYILFDKKNGKQNQPAAEVIGSNVVIDPQAETQPAQPPKDYWDVLDSIPDLNPPDNSSNQEEKKSDSRTKEPTRIFKKGNNSRRVRFE